MSADKNVAQIVHHGFIIVLLCRAAFAAALKLDASWVNHTPLEIKSGSLPC
jgi:hypothetical protein